MYSTLIKKKRNINNEESHEYNLSHEPSSTKAAHDLSTITTRLCFINKIYMYIRISVYQ